MLPSLSATSPWGPESGDFNANSLNWPVRVSSGSSTGGGGQGAGRVISCRAHEPLPSTGAGVRSFSRVACCANATQRGVYSSSRCGFDVLGPEWLLEQ
jgi:hypothetical protein